MPTQEIILKASPDLHDLLVAELADLGFNTFVTDADSVRGFRQQRLGADVDPVKSLVSTILSAYDVAEPPIYAIHEDRNWNAEWESSIRSIRVGRFVVAPDWDFQPVPPDTVLIRINPKMSFGTGHHESTRLALRLIEHAVAPGDRVLDAGTGTGILAIAAAKLGASRILAFDIDAMVAENFRENADANDVAGAMTFVAGSIESVDPEPVDVVLANINRNVLLECMPEFRRRLDVGGRVILSGLLVEDREMVVRAADACGLNLTDECAEGEWWSGAFVEAGGDNG